MPLRHHRAFRVIGYSLVGIALLSFIIRVVERVLSGQWLETYYSAKLVRWNYGSALVTIILILLVAVLAGVVRFVYWQRQRNELRRKDAQTSPQSD